MQNNNLTAIKRIFTEFLILDLKGLYKADMLMNISNFAVEKGLVKDAEALCQKFQDRERERESSVVGDIFFPEACKVDMSRPYAFILCRPEKGAIFARPDIPVRIVLASMYGVRWNRSCIRPMIKLLNLLRSKGFCEDFLKAKDENDVYCAMARFENSYSAA